MVDRDSLDLVVWTTGILGFVGVMLVLDNIRSYYVAPREIRERAIKDNKSPREFAELELQRIYSGGPMYSGVECLGKRLAYERFLKKQDL